MRLQRGIQSHPGRSGKSCVKAQDKIGSCSWIKRKTPQTAWKHAIPSACCVWKKRPWPLAENRHPKCTKKKKLKFVVRFIFPYRLQANICALQFLQKKTKHTLENTCVFVKMQRVMPSLTRKHLKCITKATSVVYGALESCTQAYFSYRAQFFSSDSVLWDKKHCS